MCMLLMFAGFFLNHSVHKTIDYQDCLRSGKTEQECKQQVPYWKP